MNRGVRFRATIRPAPYPLMPSLPRCPRPIHLVLALLVAGCGDDTTPGPDPDPSDGTVTAVIDGSSWTATSVSAGYGSRIVSITASVDGGLTLSISLQETGPGPTPSGRTSHRAS